METGADFQQRRDPPLDLHVSRRRVGDFGEEFEECALPGSIPADHAEHLAVVDFQREILHRPDRRRCSTAISPEDRLQVPNEPLIEEIGLAFAELILLG